MEDKELYWELHGNDDDCGCSYFCPKCGYNVEEETFWSPDFKEFKPLTECPKCGLKLKA